jgi:phosphate transporter
MTADGLSKADKIFSGLLDKELQKIVLFYKDQERDLGRDLENLEKDIAQKDAEGPSPADSAYEDDDDDEEDDEDDDYRNKNREFFQNC